MQLCERGVCLYIFIRLSYNYLGVRFVNMVVHVRAMGKSTQPRRWRLVGVLVPLPAAATAAP